MPPERTFTVGRRKDARLSVTVTIPAADVATAEERALGVLASRITVKGFRPGKAPAKAVREHVSDATLHEETLRLLLPSVITEAQQRAEAKPVLRPSVKVTASDPLTIEITFVERPTVTLKKPKSITVDRREIAPASDEEVEGFIRRVLALDKTETPKDGPASAGDSVRLRLHATDAKGAEVKELTVENYTLVLGEEELLPELVDHVSGMRVGEEKQVSISFGSDHGIHGVRGKKITVTLAPTHVATVTLPALTPEYLRERLKVEKTPEAFRSDVRDMLTARAKDAEAKRREEALYAAVRAATTVSLPPELVEAEAQELLLDFVERLKQSNVSLEQWMAQRNKKPDDVLSEMRSLATDRATLRLGMQELATVLEIVPTAEQLQAELAAHNATDATPGSAPYEAAVFNCTMRTLVERMIGTV